jgi:mannitol/fructose-specific phosphotransferase system IIA component (Ntr-type)/RNA polymerase-binding transcription factor DksA
MAEILKSHYFSDYLKPSQIIYDLKATNKIEAFEELLDILLKNKLIQNKQLILTRLIDRERLESTVLAEGIAVPHARVDTGNRIAVAVGRSSRGIAYDLPDKKVNLIILIVWNPVIPGLFNHLFAGLARYLREPDFRQRIFNARDRHEFYQILSEIVISLPKDDRLVSRASLLKKLQEIEIKKKRSSGAQLRELEKKASLIREELDHATLTRFDRLMERYGYAVAEVENGVCQSCNINVATVMSSAIEGSNDIYICENCGKFLVAASKSTREKPGEKAAKKTARKK